MIITLCGSTKFKEHFERINREMTLAGHIVISVGFYLHNMTEEEIDETFPMRSADETIPADDKSWLDLVHLDKISLADAIIVVNPDGYIGESTRREIAWALMQEKQICYSHEPLDDLDVSAADYSTLGLMPRGCGRDFLHAHARARNHLKVVK